DRVPDTLLPIIKRMFDEQVPVLMETARQLEEWITAHPDATEIPRAIGTLRYRLGDMEEERLVFPYNLWMWQRPRDFYSQLTSDQRAAVEPLLSETQVRTLSSPRPVRLARRNNKLERFDKMGQ